MSHPTNVVLPCEDPVYLERVHAALCRPMTCLADIDTLINHLTPPDATDRACRFFGALEAKAPECFDLDGFWKFGVPFMLRVALDVSTLFPKPTGNLPLLSNGMVTELTREQCACLISLSALGAFQGRSEGKERYRFRVHQLFYLDATPSALCFLNYFTVLGKHGVPEGSVKFERRALAKADASSLHGVWETCDTPLCEVIFIHPPDKRIEENTEADLHVDFANMQVGGGTLTGDFGQEELLFCAKPELSVAIAFSPLMRDEEAIVTEGAIQYSRCSGLRCDFQFEGTATGTSSRVVALDALDLRVGIKPRMFELPFIKRDLLKAWLGFQGCTVLATGHWGCGAFGHDHFLKFLQQWIAATAAGVKVIHYHTMSDPKGAGLEDLCQQIRGKGLGVRDVWRVVREAAKGICPGLQAAKEFRLKVHNELLCAY